MTVQERMDAAEEDIKEERAFNKQKVANELKQAKADMPPPSPPKNRDPQQSSGEGDIEVARMKKKWDDDQAGMQAKIGAVKSTPN